jgi:hypothetical protein
MTTKHRALGQAALDTLAERVSTAMTGTVVAFEEDKPRPKLETLAIKEITQDQEILARSIDRFLVESDEYWRKASRPSHHGYGIYQAAHVSQLPTRFWLR